MDADYSTPLILDEAAAAAKRLGEAWPWLAEALEPGTVVVIERTPDPRDADRNLAEHYKDKAAAHEAMLRGRIPSAPHPAALRIAPAVARAEISKTVRDVAETVWAAVHDSTLCLTVVDPTARVRRRRCDRCAGVGWLPRPPDADEHAVPPSCPQCETRGDVWTGAVCVVCHEIGLCRCDLADAIVTVGLAVILDRLPYVVSRDVAAEVLRVLDRADRRARNVAGVGEERRIIKAPCPACGRRGDFYAEVSARKKDGTPDVSRWQVRCDHPNCICSGPGCACGRPVRYYGRRHVWPAAEWDGPDGLAKRLGVDLPGTERSEVAQKVELATQNA